jgi:protoporphyrin/coproporphyrin ferrochelatase
VTEPTAVLLMAYGTPGRTGDIEAYYTDIRRGRPPTPEQLADLVARYEAIGGLSPLTARTEAQRAALQRALDERAPGRFEVVLGYKHVAPRVEDTVAALGARGVRDAVGLVLAPHWSATSVGEYHERAAKAAVAAGVGYAAVERWHLEPAYLDFQAAAVAAGLAALPANTKVLFTAHSLPSRVIATGDPYPELLRASAEAVARRAALVPWGGWGVGYQSAGRTPEPWLGPDVRTVIEELAAAPGATGLLVCPLGFVADHLEVLYDLDIEARRHTEERGLAFARTPVVNDHPAVMAALADLVLQRSR